MYLDIAQSFPGVPSRSAAVTQAYQAVTQAYQAVTRAYQAVKDILIHLHLIFFLLPILFYDVMSLPVQQTRGVFQLE